MATKSGKHKNDPAGTAAASNDRHVTGYINFILFRDDGPPLTMVPTATGSSNRVRRLDRAEFAVAVRQGLGRAWQHAQAYSLAGVDDLAQDACLHDLTYDTDYDTPRAEWLFPMVVGTPEYTGIRAAILQNLTSNSLDSDLCQRIDLVLQMAVRGDDEARTLLRARLLALAEADPKEAFAPSRLVELDGAQGLLAIARVFGLRLMADPDSDVNVSFFDNTPDSRKLLRRHRRAEPTIRAFADYLEALGVWDPPKPVDPADQAIRRRADMERRRQIFTLERALREAQEGSALPKASYAAFGKYATAEELDLVYAHLLAATDDGLRTRLLGVFRRASLPRVDDVLLSWAAAEADALRAAAIWALSHSADARVHTLARTKASRGQLLGADSDGLRLFLNNYDASDADLIAAGLAQIRPGRDDAHGLGQALVELAEQYPDAGLAGPLRWVYENTPCLNCRHRAVMELDRRDQLDAERLQECRFDAEPAIRELAEAKRVKD